MACPRRPPGKLRTVEDGIHDLAALPSWVHRIMRMIVKSPSPNQNRTWGCTSYAKKTTAFNGTSPRFFCKGAVLRTPSPLSPGK